jgi:hypothetical protein
MKEYKVCVKFINREDYFYPKISAKNNKNAIIKVKLDRQRRGDEMFIKSIKVYPTKKEK